MRSVLICGAGGFIGSHAATFLKQAGYWVEGVDIKKPSFSKTACDQFFIRDLCDTEQVRDVFHPVDEVWQFAAQMGGANYVFTGEHDADILHDSAMINLNVANACREWGVGKVFFASSACAYPDFLQTRPDVKALSEDMAWPARPDSAYGIEKLFAEEVYKAYAKNYGLKVKVGRYHNVFGEYGTWRGGREKAPAALCRKVAEVEDGGEIDIIGDGLQTRSFLHVSEAIVGTYRLMNSDFQGPVNIGSSELVSINQLAQMICEIAGKNLTLNHIPGPQGVRGRCSENSLIREKLGWAPSRPLREGLEKTYRWIEQEVNRAKQGNDDESAGPVSRTGAGR